MPTKFGRMPQTETPNFYALFLNCRWSSTPRSRIKPLGKPPGVLVYLRTAEGNDALAWMADDGHNVTESQFKILRAAGAIPAN
jgi:hypothetical protein